MVIAPLFGSKVYDAKVAHLKLFADIKPRISIRFEGLGLTLKNGTNILSAVNGEFGHSKLFAVMGPSGAGETAGGGQRPASSDLFC